MSYPQEGMTPLEREVVRTAAKYRQCEPDTLEEEEAFHEFLEATDALLNAQREWRNG